MSEFLLIVVTCTMYLALPAALVARVVYEVLS